jgi:hypothetical protein
MFDLPINIQIQQTFWNDKKTEIRAITIDFKEVWRFSENKFRAWRPPTQKTPSSRSPTRASNCKAVSETIYKKA